jgi:hypothetical protein
VVTFALYCSIGALLLLTGILVNRLDGGPLDFALPDWVFVIALCVFAWPAAIVLEIRIAVREAREAR